MSGKEQLLDLTNKTSDQTERIRAMNRTANETQQTSNNIMQELGSQHQKIVKQIETNQQISEQLRKANSKTNEMTRRNVCIKCALYIAILVLLALIVGLVIFKISKMQ